jgi:uncharacterized membrane protein YhdT
MNDLAVATALATSPTTAFTELRERPRFWFPLLALVISTAVMIVWYYSVVDIDWLKEQMFGNNPDMQKLPAEQRAAAMQFVGKNTMMIGGIVGATIAIPVVYLINSLYLLLAAKVTKIPIGFKHWFTLTCWSALPGLLGAVAAIIMRLLRSNDQVGPGILQPLGLNELFFHRPLGSPGQGWLDALNIPAMLGWILAIIGLRTWSQRSWLFSTVVILIPAVLIFGIWAMFAFR